MEQQRLTEGWRSAQKKENKLKRTITDRKPCQGKESESKN